MSNKYYMSKLLHNASLKCLFCRPPIGTRHKSKKMRRLAKNEHGENVKVLTRYLQFINAINNTLHMLCNPINQRLSAQVSSKGK